MAAARRKDIATQLSRRASIEDSCPMDGRATLRADAMKGIRKEAMVAVTRAALWLAERSGVIICPLDSLVILASVYVCHHSHVIDQYPFHLLLVAGNDPPSPSVALHSQQLWK
jgi:hypothetical protein